MPSIKRCTAVNTITGAVTFVDVDIGGGAAGPAGPGVPVGGTANQILSKIDASNYNTQWVTPATPTVADGSITNAKLATMAANSLKGNNTGAVAAATDLSVASVKTLLALSNVDNTTDAGKPVSTAQATAIGLKADKTISIGVTAPITGGGDLSSNRTIGISSFAGSAAGAVPVSVGGSVNFLRADGQWASPALKYTTTVGGAVSQVITHGLNTQNVVVQVFRTAAPYDTVICDVERTSTTTCTLRFTTVPAANEYTVVVV